MVNVTKGDRVKVTITGTATSGTQEEGKFWLLADGSHPGHSNWIQPEIEGHTVELIEPVYEVGEAYRDACERVFLYISNHSGDRTRWLDFNGNKWNLGFPTRPLVKLVPEKD